MTLLKRGLHLLLLICLSMHLLGCGFRLRGHSELPEQLRALYLQSVNPYSAFTKELRAAFRAHDINVVPCAAYADITFEVLNETFNRQTVSVSASTQLIQYVLTYNVTFQLRNRAGDIILGPQVVKTSRSYAININQMLAGNDAQQQLEEEMRRDVIYQIFYRLSSRNSIRAIVCQNNI